MDDTLYLTTYEAALAVVATAMKKSRLRIDTLIINSFIGGMLFSTGGMLHTMVESNLPEVLKTNPGFVLMITGFCYPIALFYVVITGVDLFNSNVLFFSTAYCRRAVSILDVLISWMVSWWLNLVGTIFVAYVISHYSGISQTEAMVQGTIEIALAKSSSSFVQTFIKAIAGNFFVCFAIFLQLMAKPIHVKFLMILLPIFTFVSIGFTHCIADMYVMIIGLINGAPLSVGLVAWKVFVPAALGNIVGGSFYGIVITWYLHIYVVEQDQKRLKLPKYDVRDEQPELNMDSRVVRQRKSVLYDQVEEHDDSDETNEKLDDSQHDRHGSDSPDSASYSPQPYFENLELRNTATRASAYSTATARTMRHRSPKNVFPVYGMGPPLAKERTIADGRRHSIKSDHTNYMLDDEETGAEFIGERLKKVITNKPRRSGDLEAGAAPATTTRRSLERQVGAHPRFSWTLRTDDFDRESESIASSIFPSSQPEPNNHKDARPQSSQRKRARSTGEQDLSEPDRGILRSVSLHK